MKEESLLLLSDLQKLINQVVLIDYTIIILGGEYFMQMLREEVGEAFAQRKALARKRGEEAGTKLLLPMIMMLGIVLIIIVVPAFMSF